MKEDQYWKPWSLVDGCTPVSEGCQNCWSTGIGHRFKKHYQICNSEYDPFDDVEIINVDTGKFTGNIIIREDRLDIPLRTKKPTVFSIWNDLFHGQVKGEFILKAYRTMSNCPQHIFLALTKRAERMRTINEAILRDFSIVKTSHIWHGVTCESQQRADERIPYLLPILGKKFLSLEPLLENINLYEHIYTHYPIDWVVVGCETGPHRRPCKIEWIESIVQQCKNVGVPCFVKAININGKVIRDINKFPEHLRVRELPWKR